MYTRISTILSLSSYSCWVWFQTPLKSLWGSNLPEERCMKEPEPPCGRGLVRDLALLPMWGAAWFAGTTGMLRRITTSTEILGNSRILHLPWSYITQTISALALPRVYQLLDTFSWLLQNGFFQQGNWFCSHMNSIKRTRKTYAYRLAFQVFIFRFTPTYILMWMR